MKKYILFLILTFLTVLNCLAAIQISDTNKANYFVGNGGGMTNLSHLSPDTTNSIRQDITNTFDYYGLKTDNSSGSRELWDYDPDNTFGDANVRVANDGIFMETADNTIFWSSLDHGFVSLGWPAGSKKFEITDSAINFYGPNVAFIDSSPIIASLSTNGDFILYIGSYVGNGETITNLNSTNIVVNSSILSPSSNKTNYTVPLLPGPSGNMLTIYTANTNVFITFTGTNIANAQRTVKIDCYTNSLPITVSFNQILKTNLNFNPVILDSQTAILNFYNMDTTGTQLHLSDMGRYQ